MKNILFLIMFITVLSSCKEREMQNDQREVLIGDLYFPFFRFGSLYGYPDSTISQYEKALQTKEIKEYDSLNRVIAVLREHNLTKSPYIYLKAESGKASLIYLSEEDYEQFTTFSHKSLIDNKQKVAVELKVEKLADKMYLCESIVSVEVISGETLPKQGKFKIKDYQ